MIALPTRADLLLGWDFNGDTGSQIAETSVVHAVNVSDSILTRGAGLTSQGFVSTFNSRGWSTNATVDAAIINNDYIT